MSKGFWGWALGLVIPNPFSTHSWVQKQVYDIENCPLSLRKSSNIESQTLSYMIQREIKGKTQLLFKEEKNKKIKTFTDVTLQRQTDWTCHVQKPSEFEWPNT